MRRLAIVLSLLSVLTLVGCKRPVEPIALVGAATVSAERIDSDPLGLLPAGALVTGRLDARALYATSLGASTAGLVARFLPLGPESNFDPRRDVHRAYGAFYAMQGADFCAVLQGTFDAATIERAAEHRAMTPSGTPLVRTRYAGRSIYTVGGLGFVVLTPHTIVSGDETGMRRALDRLRTGRLEHDLQPWMTEVLAQPNATFAIVGDVAGQGVVEGAADQLSFLRGLTTVRAFGNFQPPGMNVVGSLGYRDAEAAAKGATSLGELQQVSAVTSLFTALAGAAVPNFEIRHHEREVAFASAVELGFLQLALNTATSLIRPAGSGWLGG